MAMNRSIEGLTSLGHHDLAQRQADLQAEFQRREPSMKDIPLTGRLSGLQTARSEVALPPLSPETQRLIEHMRSDGYAVYDTAGKTPGSLRSEGMRYWYLNPALENVSAAPALLAFNYKPSEFFLRGSKGLPHESQIGELLPDEAERVEKAYPSSGLIVREAKLPEWSELALRHFKETGGTGGRGVRIFGRDYDDPYTWTDTYENDEQGAHRAVFGSWDEAHGAVAHLWKPDNVSTRLRLAPVVEISRK